MFPMELIWEVAAPPQKVCYIAEWFKVNIEVTKISPIQFTRR